MEKKTVEKDTNMEVLKLSTLTVILLILLTLFYAG